MAVMRDACSAACESSSARSIWNSHVARQDLPEERLRARLEDVGRRGARPPRACARSIGQQPLERHLLPS